MAEKQGAGNCRWAVPTLFLGSPTWFESADRPWTCVRDETPHTLDSTDVCYTCVRWAPRVGLPVAFGEPSDHLSGAPYFLDILSSYTVG